MDRHAEQAVRGGARVGARRGFSLAALLLALASGCVSSGQVTSDLVGSSQVSQIVPVWDNQVLAGVDPAHNGAPMYGLAGRVFLYGPLMTENLIADGKMVIEMYATLPEQPQGPPVMLESWEIKKELLNGACLRKDGFGQGYTLNLPWPSYRPDLSQVRMRIRYEPPKGLPIYGESLVVLNKGPGPDLTASRRLEGPNHQPVATGPPPGPAPQGNAVQQAVGFQQAVGPPLPPQGPFPQVGAMPQTGGVQQALYQAPVQQPGLMPPPPVPPPQQPFPGAYQR